MFLATSLPFTRAPVPQDETLCRKFARVFEIVMSSEDISGSMAMPPRPRSQERTRASSEDGDGEDRSADNVIVVD